VSGGSARQFQTMKLFMYEEGFRLGHLGYGAAVAWIVLLLTIVLAALGYAITRSGMRASGAA
jgi:cellobiose transport system permease protein